MFITLDGSLVILEGPGPSINILRGAMAPLPPYFRRPWWELTANICDMCGSF